MNLSKSYDAIIHNRPTTNTAHLTFRSSSSVLQKVSAIKARGTPWGVAESPITCIFRDANDPILSRSFERKLAFRPHPRRWRARGKRRIGLHLCTLRFIFAFLKTMPDFGDRHERQYSPELSFRHGYLRLRQHLPRAQHDRRAAH